MKEFFIETEKDIEIAWPCEDAVRLANAILHTYHLEKYDDPDIEVPVKGVCNLFNKPYNEESVSFISGLLDDILDEPVAVINKHLDRKLIEWKTYDFFSLLEPISMGKDFIKLRINLEYIRKN